MEENKKHPSQIIHGFLMADDRKQKEDVPILTHPLVINGVSNVLFFLLTTEQRAVGLHEFARQQETIDNGDAVGNEVGNELALAA